MYRTTLYLAAWLAAGSIVPLQATADVFNFDYGNPDNFQLPGEFPTASPALLGLKAVNGPPLRLYDQGGDDRQFLQTISPLPHCIETAFLITQLKGTGPVDTGNFARGTTDSIELLFTNNPFFPIQVGPYWASRIGDPAADASLLPNNWGDNTYPLGASFFLDLSNLPLGTNNTNGSTANLIPAMEQFGLLHVAIADDTMVDFISLQTTTSLTGDINGDGTVNNADLALAISLDGQAPPNGIGDTNSDGVLDSIDQANIIGHFGDTCIPEPATALLAIVALGAMLGRSSTRRQEAQRRL